MKRLRPELILDAGAELAEGPVWNEEEKKLYWVDINVGDLHRFDPASGTDERFPCGEPLGAVAFRKDGGMVAAAKSGICLLDLKDGVLQKRLLANPEPDTPNRFNDGKCDPAGRFLAGTCYTPVENGEDVLGGFYSVDKNGRSQRLLDGVYVSNGLCFDPNGTVLYYIDSPKRTVAAYAYDLDRGTIAEVRTVFTLSEGNGVPDGMTIDENGHLWVALFGGGKVLCVDPASGEILVSVEVPARKVTCPVFGGDDYSVLYITTAWENDTPEQRKRDPLGGALFSVRPGVRGFPPHRFG